MLQPLITSVRHLLALPGAQVLQNVHPLIVHYPIALLTASVLLYFLAWIARRESWAWAALWMLGLGTLAAVVAVVTGLSAAEGVMIAPSVREHVLYYHKRYMISVLVLSVILCVWALWARPMPRRGRLGFLFLLLVLVAMIGKGADYGGWMVYGYNAGGSLPQPIEFSP
ncbi:MAG: DUF2231 domain-containing protein [Candidatus Binataceae bacterium]